MNPSVVARHVHSAALVMLVWIAGGAIALLGAGIFAELAARRPQDGGLYAYLRDAFHPALAFIFGWTLLLVSQSGGMAAAAVTFAAYFAPLTGWHAPAATIGVGSDCILHGYQCAWRAHRRDDAECIHGSSRSWRSAAFAAVGLFSVHSAAGQRRLYLWGRGHGRGGPGDSCGSLRL